MTAFDPRAIIAFWRQAGPERWFTSDPGFDEAVREHLGPAHELAATGVLDERIAHPLEALALLLVLDQAPRNMFRGSPRAFATDAQARRVAEKAIAGGWDQRVPRVLRGFFYLPLMHSEDLADQERCCVLYAAMGDAGGLHWAEVHRDIIARFGRFPHRNEVLGRETTEEEAQFLADGGFRG